MAGVAILDYEAGNQTSVERAVRHLGFDGQITRNPAEIRAAERVIFPGVGAAGACMENLKRLGLDEELRRAVSQEKPVLGICIGSQVIFDESEEDGGTAGLGILPGRVERFDFPAGSGFKVPHMGWNPVAFTETGDTHPVLGGFQPRGDSPPHQFYFVHSYYTRPADSAHVLGTSEYGGVKFPSVVGCGKLVAVQFHVEKSGRPGLELLSNFLRGSP